MLGLAVDSNSLVEPLSLPELCCGFQEKTSLLNDAKMKKKLFQTFLIDSHHMERVSQIKEHLRYWPYVKAFADTNAGQIKVRVCIGNVRSAKEKEHYVARSRELILLCLRQYAVVVVPIDKGWGFYRHYEGSLFLRPDHLLHDFRSFIDESDQPQSIHSSKSDRK